LGLWLRSLLHCLALLLARSRLWLACCLQHNWILLLRRLLLLLLLLLLSSYLKRSEGHMGQLAIRQQHKGRLRWELRSTQGMGGLNSCSHLSCWLTNCCRQADRLRRLSHGLLLLRGLLAPSPRGGGGGCSTRC